MRKRNGIIWPVEAEDALRFLVTKYTDSVTSLAGNIAAEDGRTSCGVPDVAYADAVLRGEVLDREERRAFVRGFDNNSSDGRDLVPTCKRCGAQFEMTAAIKLYCSKACQKADHKERGPKMHRLCCDVCGDQFLGQIHRKRCDSCKGRHLRGYYVYAWLDAGQLFYIGMALGSRGYGIHRVSGKLAPCELRRRSIGDRFKVAIVRDNLTEEGARLIEATLINFLRPECNSQPGTSRAFKGLLSLDGHEFNEGFVQKHQQPISSETDIAV